MPKVRRPKTRQELRYRRHNRVRQRLTGTTERPRLVVFRSLKHIYAQLVDDTTNRTLAAVSDHKLEGKKSAKSTEVGKLIAQKAKDAGFRGDWAPRIIFTDYLTDSARRLVGSRRRLCDSRRGARQRAQQDRCDDRCAATQRIRG